MTRSGTAVFTIARNESFFLPRWLEYYGRTGFDLHVLDHESDDGSTSGPGFFREIVAREQTDDCGWMLSVVEAKQRSLLGDYRRVIFAEVDEFLVPDPALYGDLFNYLKCRHDVPVMTAVGFDVCHTDEPDLDPDAPILSQRKWRRNDRYDKTLISTTPLSWEVGFHRPTNVTVPPDRALLLVHLHYADRETAWARLESRMRGRNPTPGEWGWQNKIRDRGRFDSQFNESVGGVEPIPERFRSIL